jgi:hypothetical protein
MIVADETEKQILMLKEVARRKVYFALGSSLQIIAEKLRDELDEHQKLMAAEKRFQAQEV